MKVIQTRSSILKIPKYIEQALQKRVKAAVQLMDIDEIITDFINENNIDAEYEDFCGGCEMYINPYDSAERIRQSILNK